jgi:mRNA interferase RelE/StbE
MEEIYAISVAEEVETEDILRIGPTDRKRVLVAIGTKLSTEPDLFGKPLRKPLAGYWDLRVGNYRIIYRIRGRSVFVLLIMHRGMGYEKRFQKLLKTRDVGA